MIRPDVIKAWVIGVFVFFTQLALELVVSGTAEVVASLVAIAVYVGVIIYTFAPAPRPKTPERPSAVRSRIEAKRSRQP